MNYPTLEEALTFPYSYIGEGESAHRVMRVEWNGRKLVYKVINHSKTLKTVKSELKVLLKKFDAPILEYLSSRVPLLSLRVNDADDNTFGIESKILGEWKKRGIPCIDLLEQQDEAMVFDYVPSESFHDLLRTPGYHAAEYFQLLYVIAKIRSAAFRESDKLLLHPDMLTKNFLYVPETKKALAIDPGTHIKPDVSLERADAILNLIFIYDFYQIPHKDLYMKEFLCTLDKKTKDRMNALNQEAGRFTKAYFSLRAATLGVLRGKPQARFFDNYNSENIEYISDLLETA